MANFKDLMTEFFKNDKEELHNFLEKYRSYKCKYDNNEEELPENKVEEFKFELLKKYCNSVLSRPITPFMNKIMVEIKNERTGRIIFSKLKKQVVSTARSAYCFDENNVDVFWKYGSKKLRSSLLKLVNNILYGDIPLYKSSGSQLNEQATPSAANEDPILNNKVIIHKDYRTFMGTFKKEVSQQYYYLENVTSFRLCEETNTFNDVMYYKKAYVYGECRPLADGQFMFIKGIIEEYLKKEINVKKIILFPLYKEEHEEIEEMPDENKEENNTPNISDNPKKWIQNTFKTTKKSFEFLDSLPSLYEKFIFTNHIISSQIKQFKKFFYFYPNYIDECDLLNTINLTFRTKKTFGDYVKKQGFQNQYPEFDDVRNKIFIYTQAIGSTLSFEKLMETFEKETKNPYDEMIFLNIDSVKSFKQKLEYFTCPIYGKRTNTKVPSEGDISQDTSSDDIIQQDERIKFEKFAETLNHLRENKPGIPDVFKAKIKKEKEWKRPLWEDLREDSLIIEMRTQNIPFTPEDIATTKARLKERYIIFCEERGVKNSRKKKGHKASS